MKRMIIAVVIATVSIATFIITYAIISWSLEYVIDALLDIYPSIPNTGHTTEEAKNVLLTLPFFLAMAVVIAIGSMFIWLFAYAHKKEYEKY